MSKSGEKGAKPVGIVRDDLFIEHKTGSSHPESPERLVRIYEMLDGLKPGEKFVEIPTRRATREELERVHTSYHIETVANTSKMEKFHLDGDTPTCPKSYEAALVAAGSGIEMTDGVLDGKYSGGFALVRPPGHHAESDRAMGFCLFNNVAIAAAHARDKRGLDRILIADWDLHHGNGTQHTFYNDKRVLFFSAHQYPYYPGSGHFQETGQSNGRGYTINVPLSPGQGDAEYEYIFTEILEPICDVYKPQLVLVSAGFDTYFDDPLGGMRVTEEGYAGMASILKRIAEKHCDGKIAFFLEGGYNLDGLVQGVRAVLQVLAGEKSADMSEISPEDGNLKKLVDVVKSELKTYWDI